MIIDIIGIILFIIFMAVIILFGIAGILDGYEKQKRRNKKWEKIIFIIDEDSIAKIRDSLNMLRASLHAEELQENQATFITEINYQLSKAKIIEEDIQ